MPLHRPELNLYLVTDRRQTGTKGLLWAVEQALEGGVKGIQLREKDLDGRELYLLAEKIMGLCVRWKASLLINDRIDVALGVGAEGVHLGGGSLPVGVTRELVGAERLIGVSVHSLEEAQGAERAGADFLVFGPIYFTLSKAAYGRPQGIGLLKKVVEKVSIPVYPIGGIVVARIAELKGTGVRGVALITAVMASSDPRAASQEILKALEG